MTKSILVGQKYIATRGSKSQLVLVDHIYEDGTIECSYGLLSSHECIVKPSDLRPLTAHEAKLSAFELPQQFYQSGAIGFDSMDDYTYRS